MPHEFGKLPITYFQTLLDHMTRQHRGSPVTRSDTGDETDVEVVDVDDLIRKGQLAKAGTNNG